MALDSANYPSELQITTPPGTDPISEGYSHIQTSKRALKNGFPNVGGQVNATHEKMNQILDLPLSTVTIPDGGIIMWSGSLGTIPTDWYLCDGTNGTPNLSGKFIVGYDTSDTDFDTIGETGGDKSQDTSHSHGGATERHALTAEQGPTHTHRVLGSLGTQGVTDPLDGNKIAGEVYGGAAYTNHGTASQAIVENAGNGDPHDHNIPTENQIVATVPPYYVLAFIQYQTP